MKSYLQMLQHILSKGVQKGDRTGTGTVSVFGYQHRHDLAEGFPLLTTKKIHWKSVAHELLWFIRGDTNVKYLQENGVTIWDEWADENGDLGPVYGKQWRRWQAYDPAHELGMGGVAAVPFQIDQLADVIGRIRTKPDDRRLVVTAWNPADVPKMKLPPCHMFFQFYVAGGRLSCHMYQRSADAFLGVPFNIASYALLTHMVAHVTGLQPGELITSYGDLHVYNNHMEQVELQLSREPRALPKLIIDGRGQKIIEDYKFEDLCVTGYDPHPGIKAPVAI